MKLKRFNEMYVDAEGNVWDNKEMTNKSFEFADEIVATIDEGDPEQGTSFEIKFWELTQSKKYDAIQVNGEYYCLTTKDFDEFIPEPELEKLSSYDIHPEQIGILSVYGEYTYKQMEKMLTTFGIKVVTRDGYDKNGSMSY
jgi:hypothetical protein